MAVTRPDGAQARLRVRGFDMGAGGWTGVMQRLITGMAVLVALVAIGGGIVLLFHH